MKYAVILNNTVVNVIAWDSAAQPDYTYPFAHDELVAIGGRAVGIGYTYEDGEFIAPPPPPEEEEEPTTNAE